MAGTMTSKDHGGIASGHIYSVTKVAGEAPSILAEFVGNTDLLIECHGDRHHIFGVGVESVDGVRFYEKDIEKEGHDVRLWSISERPDGAFTAEHIAAI